MATRKNSLYVFVMQLPTVSCTKRKCYRYSVNFQSSTPPTTPPPQKKKCSERAPHCFSAPSKAFQQGSLICRFVSLLLKSKDPQSMTCIMIFNARQRVTGYNVYFKASQRVLAKVFSITYLFACEEVLHQLTLVFSFGSPVFGLQVFSLQFKDNCLLRLFITKFTLFHCHYYYFFYIFFLYPIHLHTNFLWYSYQISRKKYFSVK